MSRSTVFVRLVGLLVMVAVLLAACGAPPAGTAPGTTSAPAAEVTSAPAAEATSLAAEAPAETAAAPAAATVAAMSGGATNASPQEILLFNADLSDQISLDPAV